MGWSSCEKMYGEYGTTRVRERVRTGVCVSVLVCVLEYVSGSGPESCHEFPRVTRNPVTTSWSLTSLVKEKKKS